MTDGFTADPDAMHTYAGQLGGYVGAIGGANDAANTVMNVNARKAGPLTDGLRDLGLDNTGQLDAAYGLLCQPYGMTLQNMQQKVAEGIKGAVALMAALQHNLGESAKQYTEADQRARTSAKQLGNDVERLTVPRIHGTAPPTIPLPPKLPALPQIPGTPDGGAAHD